MRLGLERQGWLRPGALAWLRRWRTAESSWVRTLIFLHTVRHHSAACAAADAPSQAQIKTPAFQTLSAQVRSDCVLATKARAHEECTLWDTPRRNSWLPSIDVCGFCIGLCGSSKRVPQNAVFPCFEPQSLAAAKPPHSHSGKSSAKGQRVPGCHFSFMDQVVKSAGTDVTLKWRGLCGHFFC